MNIAALLHVFRQMASLSQPESCAKNVAETERSDPRERPESDQTKKLPEQEYDFIEDLPQDFFCPVTFELLRDPQLTTCCGHILSQRVVTKLQQEGKPCPMCKDPSFPSVPNKHFKRKVEELKVRCSHTRNGCTWEGQLGNLDHHSKSCPKRPWQCQYCDFRGTYDIGTTDHLPNCTKYPEPCPNQCDIGTVPRCDMEKHLTECPLQLVECEFAQAGCQEKVPRQDLSRHMEEGAQRHLLSMSLLNLSLTRELHQKMAEKNQQIAELQGQLQEQSRRLEEQFQEIKDLQKQRETQLQKQDEKITDLQEKMQQQMQTQLEETKEQVSEIQTQLRDENKVLQKMSKMQEDVLQLGKQFLLTTGFQPPIEIALTKFSLHKAKGGRGEWHSNPFYSHPVGYKFALYIDTNGYLEAKGTHITADLYLRKGEHDDYLFWPIQVTAHLQLLNQRGDHGHVVASVNADFENGASRREIARKFIAHSELGYSAVQNTQYLKDDCLYFRLYLKVSRKL